MHIKIKLRYLILIALTILFALIFLFVKQIKYSVFDVNADNYRTILKPTDESILSIADALSSSLPGNEYKDTRGIDCLHFNIGSSNVFSEDEDQFRKVEKSTYKEMLSVVYNDKTRNFRCQANWKGTNNNILTSCAIDAITNKIALNPYCKDIIDKLIVSESFILKESALKTGSDILVKDNGDNFIIVSIGGNYSRNEIISLFIRTYSKDKYYLK